MERLGLRRLQEVVVLVVVAERLGDRPAALGEVLPGVLEHVELEFGAGLDGEARVRGARDLALEDRSRRDRDLLAGLLVDRVGQDERGPGQPREDAQLVPDRLGDPVAVAGLPVHELEPSGVFISMSVPSRYVQKWAPWRDDPVEEGPALDALAHEPALHVGEGDHDRVDPTVANHRLESSRRGWCAGRTWVAVVAVHGTPPRPSARPYRACAGAACAPTWRSSRRRRR